MINSNDLVIVPADILDLKSMLAVEQASHQHPWSENMLAESLNGEHRCWVLKHKKQVIGHLIVLPVFDQVELLDIAVCPQQQGMGLGRLLMEHLIQFVKDNHIVSIFLEVRQSNKTAMKLYQNFDFEEIGVRKNYYPCKQGREDAVVMQFTL
ncbi:ribosomal protein S18-alanine N-acetyltransferase [Aliikangiella coralliicola]|uniref:[Ribosomal protein bS18]-alanine N-acetyltransferase n=1 Tax=Aliikangiella coralliicola TaxID=2592383 RepID=A0A545U0C2_9GAMM|nr:ribosomal protein S18-alanine N-acetyltransferase [Aliikangiella coralliicola]TQV82917.1 ribosomal-protein-alanine N-acetyltransferase [Aliikangiella coralliicola]